MSFNIYHLVIYVPLGYLGHLGYLGYLGHLCHLGHSVHVGHAVHLYHVGHVGVLVNLDHFLSFKFRSFFVF